MSNIRMFNRDCMEFMAETPDKAYGLAIVDPPYGIGFDGFSATRTDRNGNKFKTSINQIKGNYDSKIPDEIYFSELFRVSQNQIIMGAIIINCRHVKVLRYGISSKRWRIFPLVNFYGHHLVFLQKYFIIVFKIDIMATVLIDQNVFIQIKSPSPSTNGSSKTMQSRGIRYWTPTAEAARSASPVMTSGLIWTGWS